MKEGLVPRPVLDGSGRMKDCTGLIIEDSEFSVEEQPPTRLLVEILEIGTYRDGGTLAIKTNYGDFCIDRRFYTVPGNRFARHTTDNTVWLGHPSNGNKAPDDISAALIDELHYLARLGVAARKKGVVWNKYKSEAVVPTEDYDCFWSEEDEGYVVISPNYPWLSGIAETPEKALEILQEAIQIAVEERAKGA